MAPSAIRPYYLDAADIDRSGLRGGHSILGVIGYGAGRPPGFPEPGPFADVAMDVLDGGAQEETPLHEVSRNKIPRYEVPRYEVWTSEHPAEWHAADGVRYAVAGGTLFGAIGTDPSDARGLEAVAFDIYARLFALADRTGHRHVLRVFNYLSAITADEGGMERYRRFNAGRHDAFAAHGRSMEAAPAACALGMRTGPPVVCFIASAKAGQPVDNPRQLSAYRYPACYGPRSPSFSRAMLTGASPVRQLHVSGTASIVGHQSLHPGDVSAQTAEILRNLDALLAQCGAPPLADVQPHPHLEVQPHRHLEVQPHRHLKIYVRHRADVPAIRAALAPLGKLPDIMFLHAEICRRELLVEIEAFCQLG